MASTILLNGALLRPNTGTTATANQTFKNDGVANSYKQNKLGIGPKYRFGPRDFRGYIEAVRTADVNGVTNTVSYATATHPFQLWTMDAGAPNLQPPTLGLTPFFGELCFVTVLWNPYANQFWAFSHGGNNPPNHRQIFLHTSANWNGPWTLQNGGNPIIPYTAGGAFTATSFCDPTVYLRVTNGVPTLYLIGRGFDAVPKATLGFAKTTDVTTGCTGWTTPVQILQPVAATWESSEVYGMSGLEDDDGRFHAWYIGNNGTTAQVGYAYSDDLWTASTPTFTRGANNPVRAGTGVAADPDNAIGDYAQIIPEEDVIAIETEGANFTGSYTPNPLDGRAIFWHPRLRSASYVYSRKGRHCSTQSTFQRLSVPTACSVMTSLTFSLYGEFKCPPLNTFRALYYEDAGAFNKYCFLYFNASGQLVWEYRTTTALVQITTASAYHDDAWHSVAVVRAADGNWTLYVDATSVGTSATAPSTTTAATAISVGNVQSGNSSALSDQPLMGTMRRWLINTGYALSAADQTTLWNGGTSAGTRPASGTTLLDWSNDTDTGPGARTVTPTTTGATNPPVVEAQPLGSLSFPNYTVVAATNRAMERLGKASLTSPHLWRGAR